MACYHPLTAYRPRFGTQLAFNPKDGWIDKQIQVPCGQCIGCRLEYSRQWAMRITHEASLYEDNAFITLTYDSDNYPKTGTLIKKDFQDFIKRLRKKIQPIKIRYYHCGEYGDSYGRPHYHAIIFNWWPSDCVFYRTAGAGSLYTSRELENVWHKGMCTIGNVSFETAAYVARYVTKKVNGKSKQAHYERVDPDTGELCILQQEYATMSRRPGIGYGWYAKFRDETYRDDNVVMRGRVMQPPKFYDSIYELENPKGFQLLKKNREIQAMKFKENNTPERLAVREVCKEAQMSTFNKRSYEKE